MFANKNSGGIVMQKIRPDMDLGPEIQRYRKKKNMTQDQVVAKLQLMGLPISKSTYARLETNRMNIRISKLAALKSILGFTFAELFGPLPRQIGEGMDDSP